LVGLVIFAAFVSVFGQRKERLLDAWQPTHYDIAVVFDSSLSTIAKATTRVDLVTRQNDVRMIDLDFGTMPVSSVSVNNTSAKFVQHDEKLDVQLASPAQKGQRLSITVKYSGTPKDGLILTKDKDGNPSAIGDNWPDRVHHWIPAFDHPSAKASVRFSITASDVNSAVANGVPVSERKNADGTKTWVFSETRKVSPYNMVVAVGRFATATISGKSRIPITYYVPMSEGKYAAKGFSAAAPSIATFSNLVAPYPYKKLALIVGATRFGGMENANTIVFSPNYFSNFLNPEKRSKRFDIPSSLVSVDAHEIAHQWFGDSVTESTWADLWLSEGFATYFAGLFFERAEGQMVFTEYMRDNAKSYFEYEKKRRSPIHDTQTEKLFDLLNPNNYEKGGWVLHMLRRTLGDKAFFKGLKSYYAAHRESTATTEDLRAVLERSSGKNLRTFFDRWIYKAGHPIYKATWTEKGDGMVEITLTQTQDDEAFLQPVIVEVVSSTGKRRFQIVPSSKEAKITVRSPKPERIIVDPDESVLKEVVK
jgi:aminopeptidase N